ncbi:T9SS type B sorting domain-containing protein [Bizionia myxarmorum]|uniref:T9SS type B sorting domain-containing protein n=2 Tax=Bizionia myxarmorum TaxID=291186 RepID=A0A5D0RGA6_9FLAO|nr:T9SS type B sorting domain-containing protein [Bizionia myxarmorum]
MKNALFIITCFLSLLSWSQNVEVDARIYRPQELVEDVLIDSDCISNVVVTNAISGNFNGTDLSYGYFENNNSNFPFQSGIILSTGRLQNAAGPNTSLSDDDAPNWAGDQDLQDVLNESQTVNATTLEFTFEAIANQISFRYIFASEEYQQGDPNTCRYSDLFGFLIRPENETQYTNIAIVPRTQTPIKVTTVHSGIPGYCDPINSQYFGGWNGPNAPINFNGQTKVLTAVANVVPNTTYHVKLVIADHINYRYDSAVFLEAGSFQLSSNLGRDRIIAENRALCTDETLELNAFQPGNNTYKWFRNGTEIPGEVNATYTVSQPGDYAVEVVIDGACLSSGNIIIEYAPDPIVSNTTLIGCDLDLNGLTTYNLWGARNAVTNNDQQLNIENFYTSFAGAESASNDVITNPGNFSNTTVLQTVFARVLNSNGCPAIAEVILDIANNAVNLPAFSACDTDFDGITTFNISDLSTFIVSQPDVPNTASVSFYASQVDMESQSNPISGTYENTNSPNSDTLFIKISDNGNCYAFTTLDLLVFDKPELLPDYSVYYCLNLSPTTISISSGIPSGQTNNYDYEWFLNGTDLMQNSAQIEINEIGTYSVLVTNSDGCSSTRIIEVLASNSPTITDISVQEASSNNTITISVSGEGIYEFALDSGSFQNSATFTNVSAGIHTITVNDTRGCGFITQEVSVLGFPKFFTPNGDGQNDVWRPLGINASTRQLKISIFDRYGKLIKQLNAVSSGWNGTYNGQDLGSEDYWYRATMPNGKEYLGHFSLVR